MNKTKKEKYVENKNLKININNFDNIVDNLITSTIFDFIYGGNKNYKFTFNDD